MARRSESSSGWPAIAYEEHRWIPDVELPRRWRSTFVGPYRSAVVPRIAKLDPTLTTDVTALVADASAEIARFDAEMGDEIAPFAAILLRSESAASSQIENLTASATAIALAEMGDTTRRNATQIVANTRAMRAAISLAHRLDEQAIIDMHAALLDEHEALTGRWRSVPVWIGTSSYGPHTASFVPPHHTRVPAAVADLVAFMRREDVPALILAALAHAQFETIHPFMDGNGRTGRALVHSLLRSKGLTRQVTVPVSAGLLSNVDAYFASLDAYREGDIGPIASRFAEASYDAVVNGKTLVADLRSIRASWAESLRVRKQAVVWRALDVVLRQPIFDSAFLRKELGVSAPGADASIAELAKIGAVHQVTDGRRNRRYAAAAVLHALDAFAARAGRRRASTKRA